MLPLLTVVVTTPPPSWWQIALEVLAPLVALVIALAGITRDNRLRSKASAETEQRDSARALTRARGVRASGKTNSGEQGSRTYEHTIFTVTNTTSSPVYDVAVSGATMPGAPTGAEWHLLSVPTESNPRDFLAASNWAIFSGEWWRPDPDGNLAAGMLGGGAFTSTVPHMTWSDSDGRKFRMDGDAEVRAAD